MSKMENIQRTSYAAVNSLRPASHHRRLTGPMISRTRRSLAASALSSDRNGEEFRRWAGAILARFCPLHKIPKLNGNTPTHLSASQTSHLSSGALPISPPLQPTPPLPLLPPRLHRQLVSSDPMHSPQSASSQSSRMWEQC